MSHVPATPGASSPSRSRSALLSGFLSGALVASSPIYFLLARALPIAIWLVVDQTLTFILPLASLLLFVSIHCYSDPGSKAWTRAAVFLAILYACIVYMGLIIFNVFPHTLELEARSQTVAIVLTPLEFVFLGLAGVLALPAFKETKLDLTIRWCLGIKGVFFAIGAIGYGIRSNINNVFVANVLVAPGYLARDFIFPLAAALLSVLFLREKRIRR